MTEYFHTTAFAAAQRAEELCNEINPPVAREDVLDQANIETSLASNSLLRGMSYLSTTPPDTSAAKREFLDAAAFAIRLATWAPYFHR